MNRKFSFEIRMAYKNTNLKNLPGERWKDIGEYEGIYKVSNYGRIKALPRYVEHYIAKYRRSITYFTKTKIRRIKVHTRINSIIKKSSFECTVSLKNEGVEKTFLISRLVYNAFIAKLDFDRDRMMVFHKNGNGLINYYNNLDIASRSNIVKRAYELKRHRSPFRIKSKKDLTEINKRAAISRQKPLIQYTLRGTKIKKFASIKDAARKTRIHASNIVGALKKYRKTAGGFRWAYSKLDR